MNESLQVRRTAVSNDKHLSFSIEVSGGPGIPGSRLKLGPCGSRPGDSRLQFASSAPVPLQHSHTGPQVEWRPESTACLGIQGGVYKPVAVAHSLDRAINPSDDEAARRSTTLPSVFVQNIRWVTNFPVLEEPGTWAGLPTWRETLILASATPTRVDSA